VMGRADDSGHVSHLQGSELVVIDGSYGEGGGQILRTAVTLALIMARDVRVERIRAGRKRPGLRPQHLTAVRAAAAVCGGELRGDELGSQTVTLKPGGPPNAGDYAFDVASASEGGSAGSIGLVLQTVLLPLALTAGASELTLYGGTHVAWAPSASYIEHVFLPIIARMGVDAELDVLQWGFYPVGGGSVRIEIRGRERALDPISLTERGALERLWGSAVVTNLPSHIPQRMADRARNVLAGAGLDARVEPRRLRGEGPGAGIFLWAEYEHALAAFTSYGRKGLPAEHVAEAACEDLLAHHRAGAPADPHLADQLVVPMALAEGESRILTSKVTRHLSTNMWVVRQFLDCQMDLEGGEGGQGALAVEGQAFSVGDGRRRA